LQNPEYCVENLAIAAPGSPAPGRSHWKKTLDTRPIGVGERNLEHLLPCVTVWGRSHCMLRCCRY
jgi:hypothetical protein